MEPIDEMDKIDFAGITSAQGLYDALVEMYGQINLLTRTVNEMIALKEEQ